ncbi:MAG: hypothetical protein JJ866_27645, partial [Roseibium sp.]|nr:hypothetical protein [Roseibium sp.]
LSFAAVLLLPFIREQNLAFLSLFLLGIGTALTGYFPTELGLYLTTLLMSTGFHYYETMNQSLTLQMIEKKRAPIHLATQLKAASIGTFFIFIVIIAFFNDSAFVRIQENLGIAEPLTGLNLGYVPIYVFAGAVTAVIAVFCKVYYPFFEAAEVQTKSLFLRRRYWLYY